MGLRLVLELRGESCFDLETQVPPKQEIMSAKSFSHLVTEQAAVEEAVARYAAHVAKKLRSQKAVAGLVSVFLTTNRFKTRDRQYSNTATRVLSSPTASTPDIIRVALAAFRDIFRQGYRYQKVGVRVSDLRRAATEQLDFFTTDADSQSNVLMPTLDRINGRWGDGTVQFAAEGIRPSWIMQQARRSPLYTTRWQEVMRVRAG